MKKNLLSKIIYFLIFLIIFSFFLSLVFYFKQTVAFSFIDESDNFLAAHFMIKGKVLFKEIFHNRQQGMVYLSYIIQSLFQPKSLYHLVLYHRIFVILFAIVFGLIIIVRFKMFGLLFVIFYEIIKFYSHGNLFQGESIAIYPLVYLFGLLFYQLNGKKITWQENFLIPFLAWFIFFQRETLIPVTLFIYFLILIRTPKTRKFFSLSIFVFLLAITLFSLPISNYYYQLIKVNSGYVAGEEVVRSGGLIVNLLKSFFYPIYVFIRFRFDEYNYYLVFISFFFLALSGYLFARVKKSRLLLSIIFVALGLSALRPIEPKPFYAAYKIGPWAALISLATFFLFIEYLPKKFKDIKKVFIVFMIVFFFFISVKRVFVETKDFDRVKVFDINYNRYYVNGQIIKTLADKGDDLFVDGYDSLVYWQAGLPSSYKYIFFYPILINEPFFKRERLIMFNNSPPTFYYKDCNEKNNYFISNKIRQDYKEFINERNNQKTCLLIREEKLKQLDPNKLKEIKNKFSYTIFPESVE